MADPEWTTILVRYGEIGVKSKPVRNRFEKRLAANIEDGLAAAGVEGAASREWGRLYVESPDPEGALGVLARTFGVVSASPAEEVAPTVDAVAGALAKASPDLIGRGEAFAVRARRAGDHDFTSVDVARAAGAAVLEANAGRDIRVDLDDPDVELHAEVRPDRAFFFTRVVDGPGGLPLGTQGRAVAIVERPADVLAAWLIMRRGCTTRLLAVAPVDAATEAAVRRLAAWAPGLRLVRLPAPGAHAGAGARRRLAMHAARRLARQGRAKALVVGDGVEDAARFAPVDRAAGVPVFRPLVGMGDGDVRALARRVGVEGAKAAPLPAGGDAAGEDWDAVAASAVGAANESEVTPL